MENINELLEQRLIDRKYKPDFIPAQDQIIFTIQDKTIGTIENFIVFSGLPKAGKSTFISAMIASAFIPSDIFGMKLHFPENRKRIAYFDTESSSFDFYRQVEKIKHFSSLNGIPDNADFFTVREDSPVEIRQLIKLYLEKTNECAIIVIDGLLDLLFDYNSEIESRKLVNWFKKLTKIHKCLFIGVLHQGKGTGAQTLGHLGSNTDRWAQSTLEIIKDKDKKTFTLTPRFLRSSADFEPVVLMNFEGIWNSVPYEQEQTKQYSKAKRD
jgi:RecA-family ATPase